MTERGRDSLTHLPFLVDELDTASADTRVVQGFVWGPLRAAHATNIRYTQTKTHNNFNECLILFAKG